MGNRWAIDEQSMGNRWAIDGADNCKEGLGARERTPYVARLRLTTSAAVACVHGLRAVLRRRAFRGTAAKSQSASSRAFLRWGHDRFGRDPERAWERTRSSPAPTTPLAPLADHFRTVTPAPEKGHSTNTHIQGWG